MINFFSILWFIPKNFKNNIFFFTGLLLMYSLQYLIISSKFHLIFSVDRTWFSIILLLLIFGIIYNLTYYLKQSRRLGLLLLYGIGRKGLYFIVLLENGMILLIAIIINIIIAGSVDLKSIAFMFLYLFFSCLLSIIKYYLSDIYRSIKD